MTGVLRRWRLAKSRPWLVGVSGGLDSICLLHLLKGMRLPDLQVVHLNHGLRGLASDGDEEFVARTAADLGLVCHRRKVDVAALAGVKGGSLETAGRRARQEVFAEVLLETGGAGVFLAHHADDQAETVLWNLLRGTGLRGAGGMREQTELRVGDISLHLYRPLLGVSRAQLLEYAQSKGLEWREDVTNADPAVATRNRLRHDLIPYIEERMGRKVALPLARFARIAQDEEDYMALQAEQVGLHRGQTIDVAAVGKLPLALQRRVIQLWLKQNSVENVSLEEVDGILELLNVADDGSGRRKISVGSSLQIARSKMQLHVDA